jgi:hypothetical protein
LSARSSSDAVKSATNMSIASRLSSSTGMNERMTVRKTSRGVRGDSASNRRIRVTDRSATWRCVSSSSWSFVPK